MAPLWGVEQSASKQAGTLHVFRKNTAEARRTHHPLPAQTTPAKDDPALLSLMPVLRQPHAGKAAVETKQVVYIPPQTAPGLGPPHTWNGAWIQLFLLKCRMKLNDVQ